MLCDLDDSLFGNASSSTNMATRVSFRSEARRLHCQPTRSTSSRP
ncbi:MAG: hypothetical protein R3F43_03910 [bacterium]